MVPATASLLTSTAGTTAVNDRGLPSQGIAGLAPGARIVAVRAVEGVVVAELSFFPSDIAEAVWHCIESDCDVITMSIGGVIGDVAKDAAARSVRTQHHSLCCGGQLRERRRRARRLGEVIACAAVGLDPVTRARTACGGVHRRRGSRHLHRRVRTSGWPVDRRRGRCPGGRGHVVRIAARSRRSSDLARAPRPTSLIQRYASSRRTSR